MNPELWKSSTKNIYIGVILYYLCDILADILGLVNSASSLASFIGGGSSSNDLGEMFEYIFKGTVFVGAILIFVGLGQFKNAVDKADKANVNKLYNAIILLFIESIVDFIPLLGWAAGIMNIIAMILMITSFSGLKKSQTFPTLAQKGASQLFTAMVLSIIAIVVGWIPLIGVIGIVFSIIALIFILSGWKNISREENTDEVRKQNPEEKTNMGEEETPEAHKMSDEYRAFYSEADKKTDEEISLILEGSTATLNPMYVEALKDVNATRIETKKLNEERKVFLNEAIEKTAEEREQLLSNSTTLNPFYAKALRYLTRCSALKSTPTYKEFLLTFEPTYIEPETPAEKEARLKDDEEIRISEENRIKEKKARIKNRSTVLKLVILIVSIIILSFILVPSITKKHNDYNTHIKNADNSFASMCNDQKSLELYNKALSSLPLFGKKEKEEYIQNQIRIIKNNAIQLAKGIIGQLQVAKKDLSEKMSWEKAVKGCRTYSEGSADLGCWRLPEQAELQRIYCNHSKLEAINDFATFMSNFYWSSTEFDANSWYVFFSNGHLDNCKKSRDNRVRCVRDL